MKQILFISLTVLLTSCGREHDTSEACKNDAVFVEKELSGSFETLIYSSEICLQGLIEIPGPAEALISFDTESNHSNININARKLNETTFAIALPSDAKQFLYHINRPADASKIESRIGTTQKVITNGR